MERSEGIDGSLVLTLGGFDRSVISWRGREGTGLWPCGRDVIAGIVGALIGGYLAANLFHLPDPISGINLTTIVVAAA